MPHRVRTRPARSTLVPASGIRLVLTTAPARAAGRLARALVGGRFAACVNVVPGVRSTYRWKGRVERAGESLLVVKTTARALDPLIVRIATMHPYETPELLVLRPSSGLSNYLTWVSASCDARAPQRP